MHRIDVMQKSRYKAAVLVLSGAINISVFSRSRRHTISFPWILLGQSFTIGWKSFNDGLARRGFKIYSVIRLLARALSLGRLSIVEEWAAADLVIAEAATIDLVHWSSLASAFAAFLPDLEPIEDPRPLSEYLDGRRLCRGRREERLPRAAGSWVMTPSMIGPYDLVVGMPTV
jgi:hypothetical protein